MLNEALKKEIRESFNEGALKVFSVNPDSLEPSLEPITDVMRHFTPHKMILDVETLRGHTITTEDHSLFRGDMSTTLTSDLRVGDSIACLQDGVYQPVFILSISEAPREQYTYDLSVPRFENFVLSNGVVAHNSYSIGGVSLDIEKSSRYESLKQNAEGQFDKATEAKQRTTKFIRGLQQPRFGLGVRSSFGPAVGRGVLTPRAFI